MANLEQSYRITDSLNYLLSEIDAGVEFPDAFDHACERFRFGEVMTERLLDAYDANVV